MAAMKKATAKSHGRERPARAEELSSHGITDDERIALGLAAKKAGKSVSRFVQEMVAEKKALPKKRMGRPPKGEETRSVRLGIRLSPSERAELDRLSERYGMPLTELLLAAARAYRG